jgi:hypothetical protein
MGGIHLALVGASTLLYTIGILMATGLISFSPDVIIAGLWIVIAGHVVTAGNSIWGLVSGIIILTRPRSGRYAFDADGRVLQ